MEHICVDRGGDKCPCVLMESGQCYTCNMIQKGKCDCSSLWQGVCPYTEYLQRGKKIISQGKVRSYTLCGIKSYSPTLTVLTLEVPLAFGVKCKEMGAFLMVKWKDWFIPLSVLRVREKYKTQNSYIDVAINATGPKSIGLLKKSIIGDELTVKGPFYSGLLNKDSFNKRSNSIVVARGMAVMPLVNSKDLIRKNLNSFRLDTNKLTEEFLEEYLADTDYELVNIERDLFDVCESMKEDYGYCFADNQRPNVFLMTSPYYTEKILKLTGFNRKNIIIPNHSNMCCGEGYCGSCSYVDEKGITVKRCKCIDG